MYRNTQVVPMTADVVLVGPSKEEQSQPQQPQQPHRARGKSLRRSGTLAIKKMETQAHLNASATASSDHLDPLHPSHPNHPDHHHHRLTMDERMAKTLAKTKKKGIVSSRSLAGMAAFKKANLLDDPDSVIHQNLSIQSTFRMKIMFAFIGQISSMYAVVLLCLFTPSINTMIVQYFESPVYRLSLIVATAVLLSLVFCVKYKPPISQLCMVTWTVFNGFVFACLARHGVSNAFHQIFGVTIFGMCLSALISQRRVGTGANRHL